MSFRDVIQRNFTELCDLTVCNQRLVDTCWELEIFEKKEKEEIELQNPPTSYAKNSKFYKFLLRKTKSDFLKILQIFKSQETSQTEEVISILETFFTNDEFNSNDEENCYILQRNYDNFLSLQISTDFKNYTYVELTYVETDFSTLWINLHQCVALKTLILNPIQFTGNFGTEVTKSPALNLPHLEEFKFDRIGKNQERSRNRIRSIINLMLKSQSSETDIEKQDLKTSIFFNKGRDWDVDEILNLNTNIEISIGSEITFCVDHHTGMIISTLDFTHEILKTDFGLRKLALKNCETENLFTVINFSNLTHLNLFRVRVNPKILSKCINLEGLSIWKCGSLTLNLSDFSRSMKNLTLSHVRIEHCLNVSLNDLQLVYFDQCFMDKEILNNFCVIFNSKIVSINPWKDNCSMVQMHPILNQIFKNPKTTSIRMWMFRQFGNDCTREDFEEVEDFLKNLNLRGGLDRFCGDQRFILKKMKDDKWIGETLSPNSRDELYYHLYGGQDFWKSFEVYQQCC